MSFDINYGRKLCITNMIFLKRRLYILFFKLIWEYFLYLFSTNVVISVTNEFCLLTFKMKFSVSLFCNYKNTSFGTHQEVYLFALLPFHFLVHSINITIRIYVYLYVFLYIFMLYDWYVSCKFGVGCEF